MTNENENYFGFKGDEPKFIEKIAKKYNLSTEGIRAIEYTSDKIQLEKRFENALKSKFPGTKLLWNTKGKHKIFYAFINDNLDIFGFAKVVLPKNDDQEYGDVIMVPFHMKDPLTQLQALF